MNTCTSDHHLHTFINLPNSYRQIKPELHSVIHLKSVLSWRACRDCHLLCYKVAVTAVRLSDYLFLTCQVAITDKQKSNNRKHKTTPNPWWISNSAFFVVWWCEWPNLLTCYAIFNIKSLQNGKFSYNTRRFNLCAPVHRLCSISPYLQPSIY